MVRAGGFLARHVGMWIPRRRQIGLRNLALAFPEKTEEERRKILAQLDNMGRAAVEYLFIDQIWDFDSAAAKPGRIEIEGLERFVRLATDDKPAIVLSAHLANWELPMVAASRHGLDAAALFVIPGIAGSGVWWRPAAGPSWANSSRPGRARCTGSQASSRRGGTSACSSINITVRVRRSRCSVIRPRPTRFLRASPGSSSARFIWCAWCGCRATVFASN